MSSPIRVPFVDLKAKVSGHRQVFHAVLDRIVDHTQLILGPEVAEFEAAMAAFCGSAFAIGVANGTDALVLSLKAKGIGIGDEVITTSMSYLASTSCIALAGATPVFADVGGDLNLDPEAVEQKIGPKTKAILAVHLAGNPAKATALKALANRYGLALIEDAAQAIGASIDGRAVGTFGDAAGLSLHPLKNLGALGDAGVVLTDDENIKMWLEVARNHGHSSRDQCEFWSMNSRLDSLQAGFLTVMLADYPKQLADRRRQAERYREGLLPRVNFPVVNEGAESSYNFFVILVEERGRLQDYLLEAGVESKIHYPIPIHRMNAAHSLGYEPCDLPQTEYYSERILSLPIGPHISDEQIDYTIEKIAEFKSNRV